MGGGGVVAPSPLHWQRWAAKQPGGCLGSNPTMEPALKVPANAWAEGSPRETARCSWDVAILHSRNTLAPEHTSELLSRLLPSPPGAKSALACSKRGCKEMQESGGLVLHLLGERVARAKRHPVSTVAFLTWRAAREAGQGSLRQIRL